MRILIGYDGSECANHVVDDLPRAGIPPASEIRVISVAEVWPELPRSYFDPVDPSALARTSSMVRRAHELARETMREARELASQAQQRVSSVIEQMQITSEALPGSTATVLVEQARNWKADLVVVGSRGRGALGRTLLGSVSHSIVTHAPCSVRVARARKRDPAEPARIVLGVDGSPNAAAALNAVSLRSWPAHSEARVIVALDIRLATVLPSLTPDFSWPLPIDLEAHEWPREAAQSAVQELSRAGLTAASVVRDGDPKDVLIEEANTWQADCLFVGARGMSRIEGFLLGSVASAVATRATCSVEIVRFE